MEREDGTQIANLGIMGTQSRSSLLGICAVLLVLFARDAGAEEQAPNPVVLERTGADPHWVQGQVTLNAPPGVVLARLRNVPEWPRLLTDIKQLKVVGRQDEAHSDVELETRTLGHGSLRYQVELAPRQVKFSRTGSGVAVAAVLVVRDGPTPQQSNVVYSLYIRLSGAPGLLISDKSLHQKQEHMVSVTLADLHRAWPPS